MSNPLSEIHYHAASQFQGMSYAQIKALLNESMQVHIADGAAIRAAETKLRELTHAELYRADGEQE